MIYFQDFFWWETVCFSNSFLTQLAIIAITAIIAALIIRSFRSKGICIAVLLILLILFMLLHCAASASVTDDAISERFAWALSWCCASDGLLLGAIAGMLIRK